ncbi:hypothetical protein MSAN_00808600 [Mycena sanguinolenta]|uniref:Uncharacterized protein n=1 Tax=Mycena sanguinolenta TaxID=230812 RepID=A0A8H6YUN4_9AGAR|nr:hypothetical protein MSAN_00808600 [Mycena sanguinolenta]
MTTSTISVADRLRIAIALTALKFKPPDQSCTAYVLQLRAAFPPSTPTAPTTDGSWKTHALALEKELASLKLKYEAEQIKTLATSSASMSDAGPSNSQSVKRKPKKKATVSPMVAPPHVDLETILERLRGEPEFTVFPTSTSLFSSLSAFQELTSALRSSEVAVTTAQWSLLLSSTSRALTGLASVLHPILRSPKITVASQVSTLQTLATLVNDLVSSSLPFLLRKPKHLNKLLDTLLMSILNPVVESFYPLSRRYLTFLFPIMPSTALPVDVRSEVLHLFQSAFSPLVSVPSAYEVDLRATIALGVLRELENLLPPPRPDNTRLPRTHTHRLNALVRKDALWYLCTILHVVFSPVKDRAKSRSSTGAMAEGKIVDSFSRITNRCRKFDGTDTCNTPDRDTEAAKLPFRNCPSYLDPDVIDEVGYQMVLGAMERFWRWTGEVELDAIV